MALQSSGAISLNDVHLELGAASGTSLSMNDTDVRALAGVASGGYGMNSFYGKSASSQARITSVGRGVDGWGPSKYGWAASGKSNYFHAENSSTAQSFGSISATTGLITSGTLHCIQAANYYNGDYHLEIASSRSSNGGWTSVSIYSSANTATKYTFTRSSADHFAQTNAGDSNPDISGTYRWVWAASSSYHTNTTNATTMQNVFSMFTDAWINGRTLYFDFS